MTTEKTGGQLVEAEVRKVCERGHAREWRPWYKPLRLIECVCGAPVHLETRGPHPLMKRGVTVAGDWLAIEAPEVADRAEELATRVIRAYINELEALLGPVGDAFSPVSGLVHCPATQEEKKHGAC